MRRALFILLLVLGFGFAIAQTPVITSIVPAATYPSNTVLITGSGFSNTPGQLRVMFDGVQGSITASSNFSIEVTLPPYARLTNVEVLNTVSGLSGRSQLKAVPTFGGGDFVETAVSAPLSFASANEPFDVCSCDMDGDGKPDLAGSKQGLGTDIMLLRNTSTIGTIAFASSTVGVAGTTFNLACGDLDGNGKPDLIASRGAPTRNEIFVLRNTSPGVGTVAFTASTTLSVDTPGDVGHFAFRLAIRDLNGDGKPEIIVSDASNVASPNNSVFVFVNQSTVGSVSFAAPQKFTVTGTATGYGLDVQDLDGDSKPDVILNPFNAANVYILRNTSAGAVSFAPSQQIAVSGSTLIETTTADFNEDGKLDIAATSAFDDRVIVLLNQSTTGSISFAAPMNLTTGDGPWGINASDVDGDGDVDLLVGGIGAVATGLTVLKSNGINNALAFTPVTITLAKKSRNVRVGDLDGDAKPDFAVTTGVGGLSLDIVRNANCYIPSILNTTPLTICPTQTIRLDVAPGFGVTIYDWERNGGSISSGTNAFYDATLDGSYTVTATSESGNCTTTSNTIVINPGAGTIPPTPTFTTNSPLCGGLSETLQLTGPVVASVMYIWTGPNGFTSSLQNPTIPNVTSVHAGEYSLQLSNGTCFSTVATDVVDIVNLANFSIGSSVPSNTICQGSNLTLTVNSGASYQWIKDGVDIVGQTATSLAVTTEGAYTCRVTNASPSCSFTISPAITVTVLTQPVAAFTVNPTACVDEVLTFTDGSSKDARATAVYAWAFGDAGTASTASPTYAYTTANTFNPSLTLNYSGVTGCSSNVSNNVIVASPPTVTITPTSASIASGESVQLLASGAATYAWLPPDGLSDPAIENPLAAPTVTTTYTVTGTQVGCTGTASITIDVTPTDPSTLDVPNVFTPNGDSANDEWIVRLTDSQCTVSVFDPAGRKIFEDQGLPEVKWDGLYSGTPAPPGTYFYVISCPTGGPVSGHFLLAR